MEYYLFVNKILQQLPSVPQIQTLATNDAVFFAETSVDLGAVVGSAVSASLIVAITGVITAIMLFICKKRKKEDTPAKYVQCVVVVVSNEATHVI